MMKAVQVVFGIVVRFVLIVVFLNALVIVLGWLFGAHWTMAGLAFALSMFVWLLPVAALTMFFVLLLDPVGTQETHGKTES
jgi:hypothetical protein